MVAVELVDMCVAVDDVVLVVLMMEDVDGLGT
jgi:hypothetical protein